jgi:thiamine biosynthesis protein ThiS
MITINRREINFENGMTVANALRAAGESADAMTVVLVDGIVLPCGKLHKELLADGAHIDLLPIISGG